MAVYTEVSDEELATFIAGYGLGELLSFKGIAEGVENTNYIVHTAGGPFILTLYERRVVREDLPFFLGLMEHLAKRGVSCPTPVRDRQGRNLNELSGRPAALVTFLEGFWVRRPTTAHCAAVGRALAAMHMGGDGFVLKRANALGLAGWRPLYDRFADKAAGIAPGLDELIESELKGLEAGWPQGLPAGVIHADLFPDNVFFLGDRLSGLIDFYFACNDALAYDVAVCLNAWCFEKDLSFNATKGRALLRGYEELRPLTAPERAAMPLLARGAALRFLLTRAYDWLNTPLDALVSPKNPLEYVRRLRFHQGVRSIAEYGLEGRPVMTVKGPVVIYTDGACSGNPGPGGWAAILTYGDKCKEISGGEALTTNNRMELMAAIAALEALNRASRVELHTDSAYLKNGITQWINRWKKNGWRTGDKKPVKNVELWQRLDEARRDHEIEWHWVRGHAGHPENERADELAREAMSAFKPPRKKTEAHESD